MLYIPIPDKRKLNPDMLVPGRKPLEKLDISRTNIYARNALISHVFTGREPMQPNALKKWPDYSDMSYKESRKEKIVADFDGDVRSLNYASSRELDSNLKGFAILSRIVAANSAVLGGNICAYWGGSQKRPYKLSYQNGNKKLLFQLGTQTNYNYSTEIVLADNFNTWRDVAAVYTGGYIYTIVDGVVGTPTWIENGTVLQECNIDFTISEQTVNHMQGYMSYFYFLKGEYTIDEIIRLQKDPFQLYEIA